MKKPFYIAFIAAFLALCLLPSVALLCGYEAENRENRPLARLTSLWGRDGLNLSFPAEFDDYFEDHFGFREEMVTAFHGLTMSLLGDTLNEKVIVGKNNMLFYSETLDGYLGINLLTDEEIGRIAACLRIQQAYCQAQGISFTFAIAPNKNTIYPENMPSRYAPTGEAGNRDRLYAALADAGVETVDFAALLLSHKEDGQLYHDRDTHWNERGALLAYNAIMERIAGNTAYETYAACEPKTVYDDAGDLHNFVLPALAGDRPRPDYGIVADFSYDAGARPAQDTTFGTTSNANRISLHLFRDSFGNALLPLLSTNLGRVKYSAEFPYNYTLLDAETPDAVLIELVERNIANLLSAAPLMPALEMEAPGIASEGSAARFVQYGRSGYTQLAGCFPAAVQPDRIFILLEREGETHSFEAFPILEAQAESLAGGMDGARGFSLTLPEDLAGEYAVSVVADGVRYSAGTATWAED